MDNTISRTITGGIMIVIGLVLVITSPFLKYITLIYGLPILIVGLIIFFNKREGEIEKIKSKELKSKINKK